MINTYSYEEEILDKMLSILSNKTGLISNVKILKSFIDKNYVTHGQIPPLYTSTVTYPVYDSLLGGGGASLSKNRSVIKAVGEFIERHCAINESYLEKYFSQQELADKNMSFLDIRELIYFSDSCYDDPEFIFNKYDINDPIYWVNAIDLSSNQVILAPAQKVFFEYKTTNSEKDYDFRMSTGLACGDSLEHAILSGIYECVERDAFYTTWICKIPGKKVILDTIKNKNLKKLINLLENTLLDELLILDITIDTNIHTILTILTNTKGVGLTVAAASNLNPEVAILKSLEELILTNQFAYKNLINKFNFEYPELDPNEIVELEGHIDYYLNPKNNINIDFLTNELKTVNLSKMRNNSKFIASKDLEECINDLNKIGIKPVYIDVTKDYIKDEGLRVVKVLAPSMANIDIMHKYRNLDCPRIKKYLSEKNLTLNESPHPFP